MEAALLVAENGHGLAVGRRPLDGRLARGTLVAVRRRRPDRCRLLLRPADRPPSAVARRLERWLRALAAAT